ESLVERGEDERGGPAIERDELVGGDRAPDLDAVGDGPAVAAAREHQAELGLVAAEERERLVEAGVVLVRPRARRVEQEPLARLVGAEEALVVDPVVDHAELL